MTALVPSITLVHSHRRWLAVVRMENPSLGRAAMAESEHLMRDAAY